MFYDKITICENCLIDLSNDEFEGCIVCAMQGEINRLKRIIKDLKTPPNNAMQSDASARLTEFLKTAPKVK